MLLIRAQSLPHVHKGKKKSLIWPKIPHLLWPLATFPGPLFATCLPDMLNYL